MKTIRSILKIFNGRINGKQFIKGTFYLLSSYVIFSFLYAFIGTYLDSFILNVSLNYFLYFIVVPVFFILNLSLVIKRLHDTNSSAWWGLMYFIPLINLVIFYNLITEKGNLEENKYGNIPNNREFLTLFYSEKYFWYVIITAIVLLFLIQKIAS